jgi:hypothetical protein
MATLPHPILLDKVFDDPGRIETLLIRHAPYWNQVRYMPAASRASAATMPAGHPFALEGGAPPLFRGDWLGGRDQVEGVEELVGAPVLLEAAKNLFGGTFASPTFLYVNLTAPMAQVDAGHVDVPAFRGLDRPRAPGWLLLAMRRSALFERWAVRTATAVVWFYEGMGGALRYWPEGPRGASVTAEPLPNSGIIGDNDTMFHRVEAVGDPALWQAVPRTSELHHLGGDRWGIRDGADLLSTFGFEQLRVSLSWKAAVAFDEEEELQLRNGDDALTLDHAIEILVGALSERGEWDGRTTTADDPAFVEAVMTAYPREVPFDDGHPPG